MDGRIESLDHGPTKGRWEIKNGMLIESWDNGWKDSYGWNAFANKLYGTAFGPSGEKHNVTLTRQ